MRLLLAITLPVQVPSGSLIFTAEVETDEASPADALVRILEQLQDDGSMIVTRINTMKVDGRRVCTGRSPVAIFHDHVVMIQVYGGEPIEGLS